MVELLDVLDQRGIVTWVDGGWGADALVGQQTRPNSDLDVVVCAPALAAVQGVLVERGYVVIRDWLPTAVAYRDAHGHEVDLHLVQPTPDGGGDQMLPGGESRYHYSPPVPGVIGGRPVRCCPVSDQVRQHLGYEPDDDDRADMRLLGRCFGIELSPVCPARREIRSAVLSRLGA